ncbi:hypothetical protein [Rheinheimera sp.]|uniref:hypothetical protein n=1 Tax=Rheinheimera sp. TaxID=1869214 RepID=UPI004047ECA1
MSFKKILFFLLLLMFGFFLYGSFKLESVNSLHSQGKIESAVFNDDEPVNEGGDNEVLSFGYDKYESYSAKQDYYSQALSLISLAENGDVEAQFQLAEIISHCEGINAWKQDFEQDFYHFKAMNISEKDLLYMDNLMLEVTSCAAFDGQAMDIFSGQPLSGLSGLQIASVWYVQAALQGHRQAAIDVLYFIEHISKVNYETKQQVAKVINAFLPSLAADDFIGLAAYAEDELDQIAIAKLGCADNVKCDSIDSVPLPHINFYGCMKSAVNYQIAGINTKPTNCVSQGLNHYIAERSSKYSAIELEKAMQKIRNAAQYQDLKAMGLSGLSDWLETND